MPELPLRSGAIVPESPLEIANALRDASPDAWGRRVIAHRLASGHAGAHGIVRLDELIFMLRSGSDRTALHRGFEMLNQRPVSTATAVEVCRTIKRMELDIRTTPGTALVNWFRSRGVQRVVRGQESPDDGAPVHGDGDGPEGPEWVDQQRGVDPPTSRYSVVTPRCFVELSFPSKRINLRTSAGRNPRTRRHERQNARRS